MTAIIGIGLVALVLWSSWSFYARGRYKANRPTPDLQGFSSTIKPSDDAAPH